MAAWPEMEQSLQQGAIVVLEDATLRIRCLPISVALTAASLHDSVGGHPADEADQRTDRLSV